MKKLLLIFCLYGIITYAQTNPFSGRFSPSVEGMATFSFTDYESSRARFGIRLSGDYYLPLKSTHAIGFRLSASHFQIAGEDPNKDPFSFKTNITGGGFGFTYLHSAENIFFKTLYAGVSYIWFDPLIESGDKAPNNNLNLYKKSSPVYDFGAGLKYLFTSYAAVNASFMLHYVTHDNLDDITVGKHYDVFTSVSLGLSFLFGYQSDSDKDGITGKKDKCPDAPEDIDGFRDDDGCPDPDNDEDGILDKADKCPDLAEDKDGFEDYDGCPDTDNDKDGIADQNDECPNEAEDFDGYLDSDGCPDNDNDNDGIPDAEDKCPNAAEDKDNFEDNDGCPDLDNDGDGIPDVKDSCPDLKEDFDGVKDEDGCPDKDNDKDGIPDVFDKCPGQKETYNGYMDDDGCPDTVPPSEKKEDIKTPVVPKIEPPKTTTAAEFTLDGVLTFYDDDYEIKPQAFAELNRIAEIIKKDETSRWRIEGHTDNSNPESENVKISQQRATEVLLYFVKRGLKYSRFEAAGYGSKYPVADNSKPSGRAKNRRVVIRKIN